MALQGYEWDLPEADSIESPRVLPKALSVRQSADMPACPRHSLDTVGFADLGPVLASGACASRTKREIVGIDRFLHVQAWLAVASCVRRFSAGLEVIASQRGSAQNEDQLILERNPWISEPSSPPLSATSLPFSMAGADEWKTFATIAMKPRMLMTTSWFALVRVSVLHPKAWNRFTQCQSPSPIPRLVAWSRLASWSLGRSGH